MYNPSKKLNHHRQRDGWTKLMLEEAVKKASLPEMNTRDLKTD